MLSKYFTKVEDRFVFNISLIFWHLLVLVAAFAILIAIGVFAWSMVPSTQQQVQARTAPEKAPYPEPVQVDLSELLLVEPTPTELMPNVQLEPISDAARTTGAKTAPGPDVEDQTGFDEYRAAMGRLRELVPPAEHSWDGNGYWSYPYGQRYWDVYKQEKYRQWTVTEPGIEDKLEHAFKQTKATNYTAKRDLVAGLNTLLSAIPQADRYDMLVYTLARTSKSWQNDISIYEALASLPPKLEGTDGQEHIKILLRTSLQNPSAGVAFINFMASCIERFAPAARVEVLVVASNSYYNYFGQDLMQQKEATGMYLDLVDRIEASMQPKTFAQYYGLYLNKNKQRRGEIARIDNAHNALQRQIDSEFQQAQQRAVMERTEMMQQKAQYRQKSLMAAGGGILLIVVVAIMLVFLSIQRIVKKIEAKLPDSPSSEDRPIGTVA